MSGPMWDLPDHFQMGMDADGHGPVDDVDADHFVCWCADADACTTLPRTSSRESK